MKIKQKVEKRIKNLPEDLKQKYFNKIRPFGICTLNEEGVFDYNAFQADCIWVIDELVKNEVLNEKTDIKFQLCDLLECIQILVGLRNISDFLEKI